MKREMGRQRGGVQMGRMALDRGDDPKSPVATGNSSELGDDLFAVGAVAVPENGRVGRRQ